MTVWGGHFCISKPWLRSEHCVVFFRGVSSYHVCRPAPDTLTIMGLQPIPPRKKPLADRALGSPPPPPVSLNLSPLESLKRRYIEGWLTIEEFEEEVEWLLLFNRRA